MSGLAARFDNQALQAFELHPADQLAGRWAALRSWCLAKPSVRMEIAVPAPDIGLPDAAKQAQALGLELDGSHALQACRGTAARLRLRLAVKWQDLLASDARASTLPASRIWDSGRVRGDAAALARFVPRRPSFIVVDQGPEEDMRMAIAAMAPRAATWRHPVRVLWLLPEQAPPGAVFLAGP